MASNNHPYDPREYTDMILLYGESGYNARGAARLYQLRFPQRRHPNHITIQGLIL